MHRADAQQVKREEKIKTRICDIEDGRTKKCEKIQCTGIRFSVQFMKNALEFK